MQHFYSFHSTLVFKNSWRVLRWKWQVWQISELPVEAIKRLAFVRSFIHSGIDGAASHHQVHVNIHHVWSIWAQRRRRSRTNIPFRPRWYLCRFPNNIRHSIQQRRPRFRLRQLLELLSCRLRRIIIDHLYFSQIAFNFGLPRRCHIYLKHVVYGHRTLT